MKRILLLLLSVAVASCATEGGVIGLEKSTQSGHYYIMAVKSGSLKRVILIDARTEIGSYLLCDDHKRYVLLRYYSEKNNIEIQDIKSGKLTKLGVTDSLYGELSCTGSKVTFKTKENEYAYNI